MPSVYILEDATGRYYVGSTVNLTKRLRQHELRHSQTTRNMLRPVLVFSQEYASLAEARALEFKIKKWKRRDFIEKIVKDGYIKVLP